MLAASAVELAAMAIFLAAAAVRRRDRRERRHRARDRRAAYLEQVGIAPPPRPGEHGADSVAYTWRP